MFPDGAKSVSEVTKRPESAGTHFKNSIIALVDNLAAKVSTSIIILEMCLSFIWIHVNIYKWVCQKVISLCQVWICLFHKSIIASW